MKEPKNLRVEPDREPRTQYAALPWRAAAEGIEVLLITSRDTGRWVIPKGWPIKDKGPHRSAAQEAFEESGVLGEPNRRALGIYHYDKRLKSGRLQHVRVFVFPLKVTSEADEWPEKGQRQRAWTKPAQASQLVDEPELKKLLAKFEP